ncbi:vWA domain-containing protein [Pelosinus propionicus]|uniref:Magnesium chelatase subunit D n=1 Tax=Pelosinus propionicus DSM 13327 TaxID=1123291 RepID=A0A1I4KSP8_9FIRM|nr:VWA domain-containing protein [Pelosinus propionicus]SFL81814.1 magnesium chelatase subunit D [Pelosinus propionicus DSM 13327]
MISREGYLSEPQFLIRIASIIDKLVNSVSMGLGVRIGQNTVCSQKMHSFQPESPEEVEILQDFDAGQAFYQRVETGSIYHLDVFHQCGLVSHKLIAKRVHESIDLYNEHYALLGNRMEGYYDNVKADFIDIQTGTGGGRITGNLNFGRKLSLRKAHINHVHLTIMVPAPHLSCLIYIIMAVENVILSCNLELRCNEKIKMIKGVGRQKSDLTAYIDESDSLLKGKENTMTIIPDQKKEEENILLSPSGLAMDLKKFSEEYHSKRRSKPAGSVNSQRVAQDINQKWVIDLSNPNRNVTECGKQFKSYLEEQLPKIEAHLKKVVRETKKKYFKCGKSKIYENKTKSLENKKYIHLDAKDNEYGELAIGEMINAAARRMVQTNETIFHFSHDDVRYFNRKKRRKIEFCLLMDASSSMEGQRIDVAKLLARYLFFSTRDRISVIAFQQNRAWVQTPFTHDFGELEQSLNEIKAYGETPLALGLTACLQYIEQEKAYNPFIILITDGVPTLGMVTNNPVYDALLVAQQIKSKNYGFTCIGLKPHLSYLNKLSEVAAGSIFVVENLEEMGIR